LKIIVLLYYIIKFYKIRKKEFLKQLNELVDEFHPNIYLMDDVSEALEKIDKAIKKELSK
jgi:hypothetical protein